MLKPLFAAFVWLAVLFAGPSPVLACACCGTYQVVGVAPYDVLNIRSGPGVKYRKVGEIPPNSGCVIKTGKCRSKWCEIDYAEMHGWVHTGYLHFMATPAER